jgi:glutathione S-transferase
MFAIELGVPHEFRPVFDMTRLDRANYADNPALKVPILMTSEGPLYGTENICRALARVSGHRSSVVLRGDVDSRLVANAEELTLHVMTSEVTLIMAKFAGDARLAPPKVRGSIENSLAYLDENLERLLGALPAERRTSFLEVALFCVVTHLPFRQLLDTSQYGRLTAFASRYGARESAQRTPYAFDNP